MNWTSESLDRYSEISYLLSNGLKTAFRHRQGRYQIDRSQLECSLIGTADSLCSNEGRQRITNARILIEHSYPKAVIDFNPVSSKIQRHDSQSFRVRPSAMNPKVLEKSSISFSVAFQSFFLAKNCCGRYKLCSKIENIGRGKKAWFFQHIRPLSWATLKVSSANSF